VTGERAVSFFERTKVSPNVLGEIWQIADTENRGLLTKPGFCMVLRLIGHYQAGREPSTELAFKPAPIPKFEGLQIPGVSAGPAGPALSPTTGAFPANALQPQLSGQGPIRVPPLEAQKAAQYAGLFERSGAQNGLLDGATAKSIFERAGLPNEVLGKIWALSDREQRGALDQTEFIVAMHLLTSMKTRAMIALPNTLPPGLYEAAARRGGPPPSRQGTGPAAIGPVPRQFSGGSAGAPPRTQSPMAIARPPGYGTPPPVSAQATGTPWLVTPQEKAKYDQFFNTIDTQGLGIITGEQAVRFFSDSRLLEETLATIWDLADINSEGQLNRDEFAVAMYLIRQQRGPNPPPLPAFLPPALVPPSMRQQQQSAQSTAPAFDNANNTANMPKSAADDLFGLDEPTQSTPAIQPQPSGFQAPIQAQTTGASTSRDPFGGSVPASPTSPARFQPSSQQPQQSTMFKPFMPTSAFGASLAQQHTGGSTGSSQRGFQPPAHSHLQQATTSEDLLGDNETHAEESSKLTNETTELANMSNQIGNLRSQMESTQANKAQAQAQLTATTNQKRDLEQRLQQFRAQYEQEVRTVKELETQLAASRESTKKLGQELALLEGTYQDLQTQHNTISQQLQADQQENANLKQRISQINAEVAKLKPEIEKLKLDARQQKGLVSIGKKQLSTTEGERDRLQSEKAGLEKEAAERDEAARNAPQQQESSHFGRDAAIGAGVDAAAFGGYEAMKEGRHSSGSNVASPTGLSSTNPFFRKASADGPASQQTPSNTGGPNPSAFDALFGPSAGFAPSGQAGSRNGTPPATSFIGRNIPAAAGGQGMSDSMVSASSIGQATPSATPPLSERAKESPTTADEPPPPPEERQFTPSQLPVGGLTDRTRDESVASSTQVVPPASRMGGTETPRETFESRVGSPTPDPRMPGAFGAPAATPQVEEHTPGAFPAEEGQPGLSGQKPVSEEKPAQTSAKDDFDAAFADFGEGEKANDASKEDEDPFAPASGEPQSRGFTSEFPPIRSLEPEDEDESSDDEGDMHPGFDDNFTAASPPRNIAPAEPAAGPSTQHLEPNIAGPRPTVAAVSSQASDLPSINQQASPPSYEESAQPSRGGSGEHTDSNHFPPEFGGLLPAREDPTSPPPAGEQAQQAVDEEQKPSGPSDLQTQTTGQSSLFPGVQTPSSSDVFHDASSRPISSVTDASPPGPSQVTSQPAKNAFDDFDDFEDLAEAKEADKSGTDLDFGFSSQNNDEGFNAAFDSSAASFTNTMASSQQTPVPSSRGFDSSNGFGNFQPSQSASSSGAFDTAITSDGSIQNTPQNPQHDWDDIFSSLDNSKTVDTNIGGMAKDDPWGSPIHSATNGTGAQADKTPTGTSPVFTSTMKPANKAQQMGRALTPGTEHDDPILKRLTGMGYPRADALNALEMYDYVSANQPDDSMALNEFELTKVAQDINKAVDHLTEGAFG
jgi:epidermal growth factor receptor substrate 15